MGQGLLCLSGLMAVAWSAELCHDLWVHQTYRTVIALVVPGLLAWCFLMGRLWRAWSVAEAALHLQWTGGNDEQAHWRIVEWCQPVKIRVACDFQDWVLLHVTSLPFQEQQEQKARSMWSWVERAESSEVELATFHRLRALVYQTRQRSQSVLASSGSSPDSRFHQLIRFVRSPLASKPADHHIHRASKVEPWPVTEFMPTQMLAPDSADMPASSVALGGAR